jgi:hypothetical protein
VAWGLFATFVNLWPALESNVLSWLAPPTIIEAALALANGPEAKAWFLLQ